MMKTAIAFTTLLVAALGLVGCRGQISDAPPIHLNPNMDQQYRYDPQEPIMGFEPGGHEHLLFADGRAQRLPVEGTVAYGQLRDDEHYYEGRVNGQFTNELPSQVTLDRALLERGRERFDIYCTPCHGD